MASENVGTIAQAYVQIMPSTKGIKGQLASVMGGEAESAGKSAGDTFSGAFGKAVGGSKPAISAVDELGKAFEQAAEKTGGLGDQIDGLTGKLGISLPSAAKDSLNGMEGFSAGTVASMGLAAGGIAAVYEAAKALHDLTMESAEWADDLLTRANKTGLSTDQLQGIDYAQRFLDFDKLEETLARITVSMDKARDGAEKESAAFETLGVSVTNADGSLRNNWETLWDVLEALGQVENATERDATSNDLLGNAFKEMNPLVKAGREEFERLVKAAEDSGKILSEDEVKALGKVSDAAQEYDAKLESVKNKIAVVWGPASIEAMELFGDAVETAASVLIDSGLLSGFEHLIESTEKFADVSLDLFDVKMPSFLDPISQLGSALDGLGYIIGAIGDALEWVETKAKGAWEALKNMPASEVPDDVGYYGGYNPAFNALGTESWRGGLTWVGEEGPELVALPQGTRIWSNAESERIAAAGTDTSRMEALLAQNVELLSEIYGVVIDQRAMRRMV